MISNKDASQLTLIIKENGMKRNFLRPAVLIGCLIALTCVAMAYSNHLETSDYPSADLASSRAGGIRLTGSLAQGKIVTGGDGLVSLGLTMTATPLLNQPQGSAAGNVDLVIVLDRSGSMQGRKLEDARQAILSLLAELSPKDRLSLISYSSKVIRHTGLLSVDAVNRTHLEAVARQIRAGGGTNLGAGLQEGINVLLATERMGHAGKLILISDGLANQGIIDINTLGNMASVAVRKEFAISTVGVGNNFNEQLMTTIADQGAGRYHYMENPHAFAAIFKSEFNDSRMVAVRAMEIFVPSADGISLIDAAGFPIEHTEKGAVFHPGDLRSGQTRKLFLTFKVPTAKEREFKLSGIQARYVQNHKAYTALIEKPLVVACVKDKSSALASIKPRIWEKKVIIDDYHKLVEQVAQNVKQGNEKGAQDKIMAYKKEQKAVNAVVKSARIAENLDKDVGALEQMVSETFSGSRQEVLLKQKKNAKTLQFEAYRQRRAK
jgi:Ca-activated chloride channel family protein